MPNNTTGIIIWQSSASIHCTIKVTTKVTSRKGKKVKVEHTWYSASLWANLITETFRYSTRFQCITQFYLLPTRLSTNGMNHTCLCLPSRSWSSFTDPEGMEGWVGLGTTMVSKQCAQDRYVTEITVISCSDCHASSGNWKCRKQASNSQPLVPYTAMLTHYATKSPVKESPASKIKNHKTRCSTTILR